MSRRRTAYPDGVELLNHRTISKAAPNAYVTIARTFEQIDAVMRDEIRNDIEWTSTSVFNNLREHRESESYVEDIKTGTSHTSSEADTLAYLTDIKCVTVWTWVHRAVLKHQGDVNHSNHASWEQAKARANEILNLALEVLQIYESDEYRDLHVPGREGVGAGIEAKLRTLSLFESIFTRPTANDVQKDRLPSNHGFYYSYSDFLRQKRYEITVKRQERNARIYGNHDAILVTATVVVIAVSAFPLGQAFHNSTNDARGSTSDADFWLLLQTSLMQLLGLATTTLKSLAPRSIQRHVLVWPKLLTWTIAILGLGCTLSAPLVYLWLRPMYGALISSLAGAAQACMVLQLALFVDVAGRRAKVD